MIDSDPQSPRDKVLGELARGGRGVLDTIFGLIGFYLDQPINRMGENGWSQIKLMTKKSGYAYWKCTLPCSQED